MNSYLRKKNKNDFEKDFFKLMNNSVFGKTMENVRKQRDIKLATNKNRRNYLVPKSNFHTTKIFTESYKTGMFMNKPVHLGLSVLELSKILMCEFWYDYVKPKYDEKPKLCYMDTDSFIVYIKTDDIYKGFAKDVETRFDTSNYELDRPLPKAKIKKVIELMKDELGLKTMAKFVGLRAKTYSCLIDDNSEDKKAKGAKKMYHKKKV